MNFIYKYFIARVTTLLEHLIHIIRVVLIIKSNGLLRVIIVQALCAVRLRKLLRPIIPNFM